MTVKELIKQLKTFDENHNVFVRIYYDSGCAKADRGIEEVLFRKQSVCISTEGDW